MNYYTIESGVPLPITQEDKRSNTKTPIAHYTYMTSGQSVLVPTIGQARSIGNLLRSQGYKLTVRTITKNQAYRVWRLE